MKDTAEKDHLDILIVEDSRTQAEQLRYILEKKDFRVRLAASGRQALDFLQQQIPDVVVTDILMPGMDGYELCKRIRSEKRLKDVPVILVTSLSEPADVIKGLEAGADNFITKPYDERYIISRIEYLVANRELRKNEETDRNTEVFFSGKRYHIAAKRLQILDLLLSTYENAHLQNRELLSTQKSLREARADLERQVEERTADLSRTVDDLKTALETLLLREKELQEKNRELHDINATLNIMLKRRDQEHSEIRKEIAAKTVKTVLPLLKKAQNRATGATRDYMETAQANLLDVFSEHPHDSILTTAKLAPRELQIVHYIRQNKTTKEIADLLGLSVRTIESYRESIRKKLRITNQKKNLKKFITSLL